MRFSKKRVALAVAGAAVTAITAAACSSVTPSIGQYAIVTGHGAFSNQQVLHVAAPGQHLKINGGTAWYLPAQYRNFVTAQSGGDRSNPQAVLTGPGTGKNPEPGMPVKVWTWVGFELNPAIDRQVNGKTSLAFATKFFPFCFKYGCASTTPQNDNSVQNQKHFSTSGWEGMLQEVFPHAIDNATQTAIKSFGPSLWSTKSDYSALANGIAANLNSELQKMDNAPNGTPYFCGPGSTELKCTPLLVIVNNVTPTDQAVVSSYNQQISSRYQQEAGASRLAAAKAVYGPDANWTLAMLDIINACGQQHVQCNVNGFTAPVHP